MKLKMLCLSRFISVCLLLLLSVSIFGSAIRQFEIEEAKASPSEQWYKVQLDTHTGYSAYLSSAQPASLYKVAEAWKSRAFDAIVIKDYFFRIPQTGIIPYNSNPNFDSGSGWYNYSVTGSPSQSVANFSTTYPSAGSGAGSGRLYVNRTGKAMVSFHHATYTAQSGRHTLDLYRWQEINRWFSYTDSFNGNVAMGIEVRFTSGRKFAVVRTAGTASYSNSTNTIYFTNLIDWSNRKPFNNLDVWLRYYEDAEAGYDNPRFNITETYITLWGQSNYLNDKIFDFRWFVESFDSSSWVDIYFDVFYWFANSNWEAYTKDIAFAETAHGIIIIPGLEVTVGPPYNQAVAFNINSSGIDYDGSISKYLTLPTQITNRGGIAFLEELYQYPNGTRYPNEASVNLTDWLNRGFRGFATNPHYLVKLWDPALRIIFNEERSERMWILKGSDLHGNYTNRIMRSAYSLVSAEPPLTKEKIVQAIYNGHFQSIKPSWPYEIVHTNITISTFSIGSSFMGDWVTPSDNPVLNAGVRADVSIINVTIYWNGKILRSWTPNINSFSQTLNLDISGVLRITAEDQNGKYKAYSNPIFLKPTIPYIKETTHPLDLEARYSDNKLMMTVSAPTGQKSTTKVYVGDKGEPTQVYTINGNLTWSYNASTRILTLNVLHTGSANILVDWRILGDIDGDGYVGSADFSVLAGAYGSSVGDPAYKPEADIDWDSYVGSADFSILAGAYGSSEGQPRFDVRADINNDSYVGSADFSVLAGDYRKTKPH